MSQDLLDLLALQKIKSEKEAAARQMQLAMGQQQAAQGETPMTIAQQREKEVMEMTKNELAQQRGETAQQQQAQQQGMMQKLMSGIARAPGAQAAAQPKMMAAGGIVAFSSGGDVDKARERRRTAQEALYKYGLRQRQQDPEGFRAAQEELRAAETALAEAQRSYSAETSAAGLDRPVMSRQDLGAAGRFQRAEAATEAALNESPAETARLRQPVQPPAVATPPTVATPPAAAAPPRPPAPPTAAAPTTPAAPSATPTPPTAPSMNAPAMGLAGLVDTTAADLMRRNPQEADRQKQEEIRRAFALTPEQRAVYEKGSAERQKMFDEAYNREKMREDQLISFLTGAGGRRYGVLGAGAQASLGTERAQREQRLKDFEAMQKGREGLVSLEREGIKPSIEGGLAALREAAAGQRSGLEAGYKRVEGELDRNFKQVEGKLDRDSREKIAADSNRIQLEIKQAMQSQTSEAHRGRLLQDVNRLEQRGLEALQKTDVAAAIKVLEQKRAINVKGFTKEEQAELDAKRKELNDLEDIVRARMDVYRSQISGSKSAADLSAADKALVDKYMKGK
jgi:hypothetical protein